MFLSMTKIKFMNFEGKMRKSLWESRLTQVTSKFFLFILMAVFRKFWNFTLFCVLVIFWTSYPKYRVSHKEWAFNEYLKLFLKEFSFYPELWFSNPFSFATQCHYVVVPTMNSVGSNNLSLKYLMFTPLSWKDIEIRTFEFVAKTQFHLVCKILKLKFNLKNFYSRLHNY